MNLKSMRVGVMIISAARMSGKVSKISYLKREGTIKGDNGKEYYVNSKIYKELNDLELNSEVTFEPDYLEHEHKFIAKDIKRN